MFKKLTTKALAAKAVAAKELDAKAPMTTALAVKGLKIAYAYRKVLFACLAIAIGLLIGVTAERPRESLELLSSIFVVGLFILIALYHPLGGFLTWVFMTTFIDTWVKVPMGAGIPDLSFGRVAVFALSVSLLMRVATRTIHLVPLSSTDLFALVIPLAISLSAPLAVDPVATIQTAISMYLVPLAGFMLAKQFIRSEDHLHWLLGVIAFFGVVAGAHAIYEALTGHVIFMAKDQVISRVTRGDTNLRLIVGLIGETGAMGRTLAITLLVTLYYIVENKNSYFKPFWVVGAFVQFGGLAVTLSRTPLLAFLLGMFILQFSYPALRRVLIILTLIVAVTLGLTWERVQQTEAAQDRLSGVQDANGRTSRWQAGFNMWLERPIRGWGTGRYEEWSGRFRADGSRQNIDAIENDYLRILVGAGLIGFLPYAFFLLTILISSIRLFFRRKVLEPEMFIHTGTIALCWALMGCFLLSSFTAVNSQAITRLLPFVLFGAIVGSHQPLLARESNRQWSLSARAASLIAPAPRS
ncbi:MAG: O-antigen ligase family protein [Caldilineaceae bacterium]|nr:O-antigen ligase family protein [Caldilineaceae bacterium]